MDRPISLLSQFLAKVANLPEAVHRLLRMAVHRRRLQMEVRRRRLRMAAPMIRRAESVQGAILPEAAELRDEIQVPPRPNLKIKADQNKTSA